MLSSVLTTAQTARRDNGFAKIKTLSVG